MSIYLKVAGWNVLRAATARSVIEKLKKSGKTASFAQSSGILNLLERLPIRRRGRLKTPIAFGQNFLLAAR